VASATTVTGLRVRATDTAAQTVDSNTFSATIDAVVTPTVTSVVVSPASTIRSGGGTLQMSAVVNGTNSPSQAVSWGTNAGSINSDGLLTVPGAISTIQTITVSATSALGQVVGIATVTVLALPISNERLAMAKLDATQFINQTQFNHRAQRALTTLFDSLIGDIKQMRDAQTLMAQKLDADAGVTATDFVATATVPDASIILGK
jgi:hypothetical protein